MMNTALSRRRAAAFNRRRYRRQPSLTKRVVALVSSAWSEARFLWYTTNKGRWLVVALVAMIGTLFGVLTYALWVSAGEREDLACLALNVYHEARGEPAAGQYAVAEVTMNRVASPYYPDTVCAVVHQKNWDPIRRRHVAAFSWTEVERPAPPQGEAWTRAWQVAEAVYHQRQPPQVEGALFFHATYVRPNWSSERTQVARIGRHVFYR